MDAFEREYQADHSWEQLTEDEQGRLLPVVSWMVRARYDVVNISALNILYFFLPKLRAVQVDKGMANNYERDSHEPLYFMPTFLPLFQDPAEEQRAKRRRLLEQHGTLRVRRGMIRYMQVVCSLLQNV